MPIKRDSVKFSIVLDRPDFHFNATHFVAFQDASGQWIAEEPHGHDFRASVKITRALDASSCVIDFIAASAALRETLREWNYKFLLPREPLGASRTDDADQTLVALDAAPSSRYAYPSASVKTIAARNATTEEIAFALLEEFATKLELDSGVTLRLEEAPGCVVEVEA